MRVLKPVERTPNRTHQRPVRPRTVARWRRAPGLVLLVMMLLGANAPAGAAPEQGNADSVYWRISTERGLAGYLLGTIHSEDARVVDFPESLVKQLTSCEVFAMEMVPDLPTLSRLTDYMHHAETGVLEDQLGAERYARVMQALSGYQVPDPWKARMKAWAVLLTLSVPPPQTGFFMDLSLSLRAAGSGMRVTGLETLDEQLSFLENMPLDFQIRLLDQALAEYHDVGEIHRMMVDAYLTGSLERLESLSDQQFEQLEEPVRAYFTTQGIDARNQRMMENLDPLLGESRVFVAVGALHLPGEQGLIALLRAAGYRLDALPSPFVAESPAPVTAAGGG
ncbi:TraB/GumN family protein [Elongatibacter sediminis]|uniref:TraB/GumN family protein n=1 Tax=Elongatibacter sediminis TaxID=3119006 RepID=A0AAW9R815_9GAMM